MPDPLPIHDHLTIPGADLSYEFSRSGGPGGQHVNTTDTRVRLRFALAACAALHPAVKARIRAAVPGMLTSDGELLIVSDRNRSRQRNLDDARQRLADLVRAHLKPPKRRRPTKPTKGSKRRRLEGKKRRGEIKSKRGRVRED